MAEVTHTRMFFVGNTVVEERQCGCGVYTKAGSCKPVTISCRLHRLNWFRSTCLTECPSNPHPGSDQAMLNRMSPVTKQSSCGRQHWRSDPTQMTESKILKLVKHEIRPPNLRGEGPVFPRRPLDLEQDLFRLREKEHADEEYKPPAVFSDEVLRRRLRAQGPSGMSTQNDLQHSASTATTNSTNTYSSSIVRSLSRGRSMSRHGSRRISRGRNSLYPVEPELLKPPFRQRSMKYPDGSAISEASSRKSLEPPVDGEFFHPPGISKGPITAENLEAERQRRAKKGWWPRVQYFTRQHFMCGGPPYDPGFEPYDEELNDSEIDVESIRSSLKGKR